MPTFTYVARDPSGKSRTGVLAADDAAAVTGQLRERGWLVSEVAVEQRAGVDLSPAQWLPVRDVDVAIGLRQIAVMLRSGLSLLRALQIVPNQSRRARMASVWRDVARRIQEGSSLADALAAHRCFSNLVVQLARIGEQTGSLEPELARAAAALERSRRLRRDTLSALAYPSIVIVMTIGVAIFVVLYLLPKIKGFLEPLGKTLPPTTQLLIDISDAVQTHFVPGSILLGLLIAIVFAVAQYPPGRLLIDRWLLRIPVIGRVAGVGATVQVSRGLRDLLSSGVPLLEALRTSEQLVGNQHLRQHLTRCRERVMRGSGLGDPLTEPGTFQPLLGAMVGVGEQAGTLEEVLDEVSGFYEQELKDLIQTLGAIVEPLLIIGVGTVVGFVYVSVFMALYAAY